MGRYISMGPAFRYRISKKSLQSSLFWAGVGKIDEQTLKEDLFKYFNSKIYCYEENEDSFIISLRKDIPVNDFLDLFDEFQKIDYKRDKEKEVCRNKIKEDISVMKDIYEIWDYADNGRLYFWELDLRYFQMLIPIANQTVNVQAQVGGVSFFLANNKTISECEFESYDLFTNYLRFRLQHLKLADSMLIFLSE